MASDDAQVSLLCCECARGLILFGLSLIGRPILISHLNLNLIQISRKAPLLFCLLMRYLACVMSHDVTLPNYFMHHWTSHWGLGRRVLPPAEKNRKNFWDWIYPFHAISSNFGSAGRKAPRPPPPSGKTWNNFETGSIYFMQFPATLVQLAEPSPFCLFVRDLAHVAHVEYPWFPYCKSTLRFLLSKYLL